MCTCDEGLPEHHVLLIHSEEDRGGDVEGQVSRHASQLLAHPGLPAAGGHPLPRCPLPVYVPTRHVVCQVNLSAEQITCRKITKPCLIVGATCNSQEQL